MKSEKHNKTDEIIDSLDGLNGMKAPDFFYTRLKAKMLALDSGKGQKIVITNKHYKLLRPVFAVTLLVLVLAVNLISILKQNGAAENNSAVTDTGNPQAIATAYNLDNNLSYELNQ